MQHIGQLHDHALMYLAPNTIPETLTRDQLHSLFAKAAVGVAAPWILIINCADVKPTQIFSAKRVNDVLRADYSKHIQGTWLMNTGPLLRGFISTFISAPGDEEAITILETDKLGLFIQLQRAGCSYDMANWFLQRLSGASAANAL
jgi:hypothetical protein